MTMAIADMDEETAGQCIDWISALSMATRGRAKIQLGVFLTRNGVNTTTTASCREIAAELGCSKSTAKRAVQGLERDGWVTVERERGENNTYKPVVARAVNPWRREGRP